MSIQEAHQLLMEGGSGMLSTHAKEIPGYPFGSVVPYCVDDQGMPIVLISNMAQHYHNIHANPKVSLLVVEKGCEDMQTAKRITWVADAQPVAQQDEATMNKYYSLFPASRDYHQRLGFYFFRLLPVRICYIAGFGKIHWYDIKQWLSTN